MLQTRIGNVSSAVVRNGRTGKQSEFYSLDFADWVNVIAVTEDEKIVCIRQYRFGTGKEEVEIPGGAVEEGENPLDAGLRELQEETGYSGERARIIGRVCPNPAVQSNWCYTLLVEKAVKTSQPCLDEMEDIDVFLLSFDELDAMIRKGDICHGLVLNAVMFYQRTAANL